MYVQWNITQPQKENNAICSNLYATRDYHAKWSKSERENTIWCNLHVESKIGHRWTYLQNRNRLTDMELRLAVWGRWRRGGMDWGFGVGKCKQLHLESIKSEVLLHSTGKCIQSPGINCSGKEYKREYICVCVFVCIHSVKFSLSVVSDSLRPHELQQARAPCPSPTLGVHSDSCPSS